MSQQIHGFLKRYGIPNLSTSLYEGPCLILSACIWLLIKIEKSSFDSTSNLSLTQDTRTHLRLF
jgi:hypothetical protein